MNLQNAPRFTMEDALDLAVRLYGIRATAQPLPSERDQNFLLEADDGKKYVLKISSSADDRGLLEAQNQALIHLSKQTDLCPRIVAARTGDSAVETSSKDGQIHLVRLVHYLQGIPLANVKRHSPALLEDLGRAVATLDHGLVDFDHPSLHRDFYWDLANGLQIINQYEALIEDPSVRDLVIKFATEFKRTILPNINSLRRSIIHNDANDHNVLAGGGNDLFTRNQKVVGILDFGDMVYSYTVCNLAVAIAYAILNKPDRTRNGRDYHPRLSSGLSAN